MKTFPLSAKLFILAAVLFFAFAIYCTVFKPEWVFGLRDFL